MKNFFKVGEGVDVTGLMLAIQQDPTLWDENTLRTTHPMTPHTEVNDIWLRFLDVEAWSALKDDEKVNCALDQHESIPYRAWHQLPEAQFICFELMHRVRGLRLGRVMITKLTPGKQIPTHVDEGGHASYYERFHVCLQAGPGSIFKGEDEQVVMRPGEVWWVQNKHEHSVVNNSSIDRIHLIIDIHTGRGRP